mgnify:CR=1 FL=1
MDLSRIAAVMNVARLPAACVAVFGTGGSSGLVLNLARCGVGRFKLFDFDVVSHVRLGRRVARSSGLRKSKGEVGEHGRAGIQEGQVG